MSGPGASAIGAAGLTAPTSGDEVGERDGASDPESGSDDHQPEAAGATTLKRESTTLRRVVRSPRKSGPKVQPALVGFQQLQGKHPGDRYVRVIRQQGLDFERARPGHLVATEESMAARGRLGRAFGRMKRVVISVSSLLGRGEGKRNLGQESAHAGS